jgi:hypothetical protein
MAAGGLRHGAGRKPKEITGMKRELQRNFAALILSDEDEFKLWTKHLKSKNPKVSMDALKAISEHKHGKARQTLDMDARINVAQVNVNL